MVKVEMEEYTCDGCGSIQHVVDSMDYLGFSGSAFCQNEHGGWGTEAWHACKKACIQKAVLNALDKENEQR